MIASFALMYFTLAGTIKKGVINAMKDFTRRQLQSRFVQMQALLIGYATMLGYELTLGDRKAKHNPKGFHYKQLAEDYNLFLNGVWLKETEDHRELGEFWKFMDGTWGGDFDKPDGNHYSLGE